MIRIKTLVLVMMFGLVVLLFTACTPSTPSYTPNPHMVAHGATNQYSFFGYSQIQYPSNQKKDAVVNRPDYGQGGDASDASGETGFVFDF